MTQRRRFSDEEKQEAVRLVRQRGRTSKSVADELGINPRTVARWVRAEVVEERGQTWVNRVRPHFDFLVGHGFTLTDVVAENWWEVTVTYRSVVSAVEVALSFEYQRVDLSLLRLVDGELPRYPVFIVDSVPIDTFVADWLLELRGDPTRQPGRGLDDGDVEAQLGFWAGALREYGTDFLAGDLSVLDQLEQMIRDNARLHGPPEVTVWVPEDAAPEAVARTASQVQAATPADVAVAIRRYRR